MKSLHAERHLARKSELLGQMTANTEKLQRFIRKRNMLGLKRVLQELDRQIEEVLAIDTMLASQDMDWQQLAGFRDITKSLALQQITLIAAYRQTLQTAAAQRQQIAGELRSIRNAQHLKEGYNRSQTPRPGGRLTVRG